MSSRMFKTFEQPGYMDSLLAQTSQTLAPEVEIQLKSKYSTFTRFNYRDAAVEAKQRQKKKTQMARIIESDFG